MSKTYDRMEWGFLKVIMSRLGFDSQWIMLIMECVTTATYSLLINRELQQPFKLNTGLHQVDPLSPCHFIICA